jgi:hypothetical protein
MRDPQTVGSRTVGFTIPAAQFFEISDRARQHGMSIRDFMIYVVELYLETDTTA